MTTEPGAFGGAPLLEDLFVLIHLAAMAVGFGTMVSTDMLSLRRITHPVWRPYTSALHHAHRMMVPALAVAWVSGLSLLWLRTGFAADAISAKTLAKLAVVSALTLTAAVIRLQVMPIVGRAVGRPLADLPLPKKLTLAVCAALSVSGWTLALALGGFAPLKVWSADALLALCLGVYVAAVSAMVLGALVLHRLRAEADSPHVARRGRPAAPALT